MSAVTCLSVKRDHQIITYCHLRNHSVLHCNLFFPCSLAQLCFRSVLTRAKFMEILYLLFTLKPSFLFSVFVIPLFCFYFFISTFISLFNCLCVFMFLILFLFRYFSAFHYLFPFPFLPLSHFFSTFLYFFFSLVYYFLFFCFQFFKSHHFFFSLPRSIPPSLTPVPTPFVTCIESLR